MRKWALIVSAFLVSIAAHAFFIYYQSKGGFIAGPNDGLSQMVPFKHFLYETFQKGNLVYAEDFGFGGGAITQLAYYFSTSVVFWITVTFIWFFETIGIVTPDLDLWLRLALIVSIIRLTVVMVLATYAYRLFHVRTVHAFAGAVIYGVSVLYIRHVTFWEFFADAFLWIPLLVIGIERIIRKGRADLFIIVSAVMLINNFYFAYINLVFVLIYVLFRQMIRLPEDHVERKQQWLLFTGSGIVAFLLSSFAFIPAAYGFLQNERPSLSHEMNWVWFDNILYNSRILIVPAVFLVFLLYRPLYRHTTFRLFAGMSLLLTILHFSPYVGSFFNGFSAPQYRWEYLASFVIGGMVSIGLSHWRFERKSFLVSIVGTSLLYLGFALYGDMPTLILFGTLGLIGVLVLLLWLKPVLVPYLVVISCLLVFNGYTKFTLHDKSIIDTNETFVSSERYNSEEQRELIDIVQQEAGPLERLDWMVSLRNNTPIVQSFLGTSLYSSILNGHLLTFYWTDLEIDMKRESVSRYGTLGNRANLHHLLSTPYWMREKSIADEAPHGFSKLAENDRYAVFESETRLPFVRTTTNTYSRESLEDRSMLTREHAMLSGVILEDGSDSPEPARSVTFTKEPVNATLDGEKLQVNAEEGGIDFVPSLPDNATGDLYVSFNIRKLDGKAFPLRLGNYRTTRKAATSIYRTDLNSLTLRTPLEESVPLRLPEGAYAIEDVTIEWEDYSTLDAALEEASALPNVPVKWNGGDLDFTIENAKPEAYAVFSVPYERGWHATVNGKSKEVLQANYAWSAVELDEGKNEVELNYRPPFFMATIGLTLLGALLFGLYLIYARRIQKRFL